MNATPTVCVLMSTYNGCKYLHQQLDSIFSQENVNVKLIVRDDGSKDNTAQLCREHNYNLVDLPVNLGLAGAFQTGMKYALYILQRQQQHDLVC